MIDRARPLGLASQVAVRDDVDLLALDADHGVGVWRTLICAAWRGNTAPKAVEELGAAIRRVSAERNAKVGLMQFVLSEAKAPEKEARDALAFMLRSSPEYIAASAIVAPGVGFRVAAGRAIVTGIAMLARPGFPHVVFATADEATEWLCRQMPPGGTSALRPAEVIARVNRFVNTVQAGVPAPKRTSR